MLTASAMAQNAGAQQSGVAMTAESGGKQAGCVQWSHETVARPGHKAPDQVKVIFTFVNRCGHEASVMLYHQTADLAQRTIDSGGIRLAAEEIYGGPKKVRNYIFFNPQRDRYLNFWVIQSDLPFSNRNNNILDMNRCNPGFNGGVQNSKRVYPPCPPRFTYR